MGGSYFIRGSSVLTEGRIGGSSGLEADGGLRRAKVLGFWLFGAEELPWLILDFQRVEWVRTVLLL